MNARDFTESPPTSSPPLVSHSDSHGGVKPYRLWFAAGAAIFGAIIYGFDSSVINGALSGMVDEYGMSSFMSGFAVSSALLGCVLGALLAGPLSERCGLVKIMVVAAALFTVGTLGNALVFSVWDLLLWRIIGGIGVGFISVLAPGYVAEMAPARIRGALSSMYALALAIGIFVALLSNQIIAANSEIANIVTSDFAWGLEAWRWMFLVGIVPGVIYGVVTATLPESPRFLVRKGKTHEAIRVLSRVTGEADPEGKVSEIEKTFAVERSVSHRAATLREILSRRIVWVGIGVAALQQLTGINVIFYFSTTLWQAVGFSASASFTTSLITSIVNMTFVFVAIFLVDRWGRRPMLMIGACGQALALVMVAIAFGRSQETADGISLPGIWGNVALVGANLFVVFFVSTWGPITWVLLAEMFPNAIRAKALALGTASNWIFNFIVSTTFPWLSEAIGLSVLYGGFAAFAVVAAVFVYIFVPETKGKELEEMTFDPHVESAHSR